MTQRKRVYYTIYLLRIKNVFTTTHKLIKRSKMGNHPDKIENDFYQVPSEEINFLRMHTIFQKKEIKQFYKDFLVSIYIIYVL